MASNYSIGYKKPPDRTKYHFGMVPLNGESLIVGNYKLVRIAANTYSRKHKVEIIAINCGSHIILKRRH